MPTTRSAALSFLERHNIRTVEWAAVPEDVKKAAPNVSATDLVWRTDQKSFVVIYFDPAGREVIGGELVARDREGWQVFRGDVKEVGGTLHLHLPVDSMKRGSPIAVIDLFSGST